MPTPNYDLSDPAIKAMVLANSDLTSVEYDAIAGETPLAKCRRLLMYFVARMFEQVENGPGTGGGIQG